MDKSGLTSYPASAARLNYTTLCAPLAVNLKLDKKLTSESDKISALFETYMKLGGLRLQPDYLSAEDLKDAQTHPEKWCNLRRQNNRIHRILHKIRQSFSGRNYQ